MNATPDTYGHLFWGYAVLWACMAIYVMTMLREQRRMASELRQLREHLGSGTEASPRR